MAENTKIEWAHHTFNPWIGCTKVSPACDHCYAESWDQRFNGNRWGPRASRTRTSRANWQKPIKWDREAAEQGIRYRVFCASLADVFDNHGSITSGWRGDLWHLIARTPHLDWLLLTKRPQNIHKMLPDGYGAPAWGDGWPNVWLGTTVENQEEANRRIPILLDTPAAVRWISAEPLLGPVDLALRYDSGASLPASMQVNDERCTLYALRGESTWPGSHYVSPTIVRQTSIDDDGFTQTEGERRRIDWVVAGGESGPGARPMHPDWARSLRDQCEAAGVAFLFKQWGDWAPDDGPPEVGPDKIFEGRARCAVWGDDRWQIFDSGYEAPLDADSEARLYRIGKKTAGRQLDGRTWDDYPAQKQAAE